MGKSGQSTSFVPTGANAGNAFKDRTAQRFKDSEFRLNYQGKDFNVGDYWRFRVLSLHPDHIKEFAARRCTIINTKTKQKMKLVIPDPGEPLNETLVDHTGTPMSECQETTVMRIPVYVYGIWKKKQKKHEFEAIEEVQFLEMGQGLINAFCDLKDAHQGKCAFSDNTGRPEYDILLKIEFNNPEIPKKYELEPVLMGDNMEKDPNFGVSAETALGEDVCKEVMESFEDCVKELQTFGLSESDIKDKLRKRSSDDDKKDDGPSDTRRSSGFKKPNDDAGSEDDPPFEEGEAEAGAESESQASGSGKKGDGSRFRFNRD